MSDGARSAAAAKAPAAIHRSRGDDRGATTTISAATPTSASTLIASSASGLPTAAQIAAVGGG